MGLVGGTRDPRKDVLLCDTNLKFGTYSRTRLVLIFVRNGNTLHHKVDKQMIRRPPTSVVITTQRIKGPAEAKIKIDCKSGSRFSTAGSYGGI